MVNVNKCISIKGERVSLEFATVNDKKLIYDLLVSPEVYHQMFDQKHPAPDWSEFNQESNELYSGQPNEYGAYLLIKVKGVVIGSISYVLLKGINKSVELDIWISSVQNTGKGFGTEALNILMRFLQFYYQLNTFIIRPWIKNINAINAYKKCGFREIINFHPDEFYSIDEVEKYGKGDYGIHETMNMIFLLET